MEQHLSCRAVDQAVGQNAPNCPKHLSLTAEDVDQLQANVEAMRLELRAGHFEAAARLDFEFHRRLLEACDNHAML